MVAPTGVPGNDKTSQDELPVAKRQRTQSPSRESADLESSQAKAEVVPSSCPNTDVAMDVASDGAAAQEQQQSQQPQQDQPQQEQQPQQQQQQQKQPQRQKKIVDPIRERLMALTKEIHQAAKFNDLHKAIAALKSAQEEGVQLSLGTINTLMYLAVGGDQWENYLRGLPVDSKVEGVGPLPLAERVSASERVWSAVQAQGVVPDHTTYVALARMSAISGKPEEALEWAHKSIAAKQPAQLRLFHPAWLCYCIAGDVGNVMAIDEAITKQANSMANGGGLDRTEYEFALMMEAIARGGTWEQMAGVLQRVQGELNHLQPSTLAIIEGFFRSERAAAALRDGSAFAGLLKTSAQGEQQSGAAAGQDGAAMDVDDVAAAAAGAAPAAMAVDGGAEADEARAAAASIAAAAVTAVVENAAADEAAASIAAAAVAAVVAAARGPTVEQQLQALSQAVASGRQLRWSIRHNVAVDKDGSCPLAGTKLQLIDLQDEEWDVFAEGVASLAVSTESNKANFERYKEWYDRNGPYDILIDGANVAYYGQNRSGGGFNWGQIMRMVDTVKQRHKGSKLLLMLHKKRLYDSEAKQPEVQQFLEQLKANKEFYFTPPGSNDDWYWMYATVRAKSGGLLISNDELRDHIFTLLRPKHFLKWKERHIAHYSFNWPHTQPFISYPQPYTSCAQRLPNGAWMFPSSEGKAWMLVKPEIVEDVPAAP